MVDNKRTILTEQALEASEMDREAARQALEAAMARQAASAAEHEEPDLKVLMLDPGTVLFGCFLVVTNKTI